MEAAKRKFLSALDGSGGGGGTGGTASRSITPMGKPKTQQQQQRTWAGWMLGTPQPPAAKSAAAGGGGGGGSGVAGGGGGGGVGAAAAPGPEADDGAKADLDSDEWSKLEQLLAEQVGGDGNSVGGWRLSPMKGSTVLAGSVAGGTGVGGTVLLFAFGVWRVSLLVAPAGALHLSRPAGCVLSQPLFHSPQP